MIKDEFTYGNSGVQELDKSTEEGTDDET